MSRSRRPVDRNAPSEMFKVLGRLAQDAAQFDEEEEEEAGRALVLALAKKGFDIYASAAKKGGWRWAREGRSE